MRHWSSSIRSQGRRTLWRLKPPVLALGGGGARGFAHIGVLLEIERVGLPIRHIVGTSMGAVVGAMYQALGSAAAVRDRWGEAFDNDLIPSIPARRTGSERSWLSKARELKERMVMSFALHRASIMQDETIIKALDFLLPDGNIEDLPRPLTVVATDLDSGDPVALRSGPLRMAVQASSSIPGILPSVDIGERALVDGGVVAEVPVLAAEGQGAPVLAVDVSADLAEREPEEIALDTIMRTQQMTTRLLRHRQLRHARWVVRPAVGHALWSDWDQFEQLVEAGAEAMRSWIDAAS